MMLAVNYRYKDRGNPLEPHTWQLYCCQCYVKIASGTEENLALAMSEPIRQYYLKVIETSISDTVETKVFSTGDEIEIIVYITYQGEE